MVRIREYHLTMNTPFVFTKQRAALWALVCTLLLPIPYEHCFDACSRFPWPAMLPGFHWLSPFIANSIFNPLVLLVTFIVFAVTFLIVHANIKTLSRKKLLAIAFATWLIFGSLLQFTNFPAGVLHSIDQARRDYLHQARMEQWASACNSYPIGAPVQLPSYFTKGYITMTPYPGSVKTYFMDFADREYTSSMRVSAYSARIEKLFEKFADADGNLAKIDTGSCFQDPEIPVAVCLSGRDVAVKMCLLDNVDPNKQVFDFSDSLLL